MTTHQLPARRFPLQAAGSSASMQVLDSATYVAETMDVSGNGVPKLSVRCGMHDCTIFFETTDQVWVLFDTLGDYLYHNEVKRPDGVS